MNAGRNGLVSETLFPTTVACGKLVAGDLLEELEQAIWMLEEGDTAGAAWCDAQGYDGYTSYASLDDLPKRASAFAALTAELDGMAAAFADARAWNLSGQNLVLDSLWVNILASGGGHSGHIHPNSVISGTAYIAMPDGAGAIRFEDPRLPLMMAAPLVHADAGAEQARFAYRTPRAGEVLLWESWLRHEVMPHRADDPRLTISFNYALDKA